MATPGSSEAISADKLADSLQAYLAEHPSAALLEDGHLLFDMRRARYSIGESHGRCLLQLWSDERNLIRTVVEVKERAHFLRLTTRRMGAAKPQMLEIVPSNDRRTPSARDVSRRTYQRLLERVLTRLHRIEGGGLSLGDGPRTQFRSSLCARTPAARYSCRCGDRCARLRVGGRNEELTPVDYRDTSNLESHLSGVPTRGMERPCRCRGSAKVSIRKDLI